MISRRSLLQSGATATALAGIAVAAVQCQPTEAPAAETAIAFRIEASLIAYRTAMREERALSKRYAVAHKSLPAWARPGPAQLMPDGSKGGHNHGGPEVAEVPTPGAEPIAIRQGLREYWNSRKGKQYEPWEIDRHPDGTVTIPRMVPLSGEARRQYRLETIAGSRKLIARKREQDAEYEKAGLPQIEAAMDVLCDRREAIRDDIAGYATGCSPAEIGVLAMFQCRESDDEFAFDILKRVLPHLSGILREAADAVLDKGEWV